MEQQQLNFPREEGASAPPNSNPLKERQQRDIAEFEMNAKEYLRQAKKRILRNYVITVFCIPILIGVLIGMSTLISRYISSLAPAAQPGQTGNAGLLTTHAGLTLIIAIVVLIVIIAIAIAVITKIENLKVQEKPKSDDPSKQGNNPNQGK